MSTTRAPSRPQAGTRRTAPAVPYEKVRDAATTLGFVYATSKRPLDRWAIPRKSNVHGTEMPETLLIALYDAYTDQSQETRNRYSDAYHLVIPELEQLIPRRIGRMLASQLDDLARLDKLFSQPGIAGALEVLATGVAKRVGSYQPSTEDYEAAVAIHGEPPEAGNGYNPAFARAQDENLRQRVQDAIRAELDALDLAPAPQWRHVRLLCTVLSCHPEMVSVMEAYWDSARQGDRRVHRLIRDAREETIKFAGKLLKSPEHVWRYPPLIVDAVSELGLGDVYGFKEYTVDIGHVLSRSWVDTALTVVGITASFIGFLVVPWLVAAEAGLAAAGVGWTVALTDFGVGAVSATLTYTRQLEQDAAAVSSGFRRKKLAERPNFGDSYLAGAMTLIAGFAFARSTRRLAAEFRTRLPTDPPLGPAPSAAPDSKPDLKLLRGGGTPIDRKTTYERGPRGPRWDERAVPPRTPPRRAMAVGARNFADDFESSPPRVAAIGGVVADENVAVASAKPQVTPKKAVAASSPAIGSNGLGSTSTGSKGTGAGTAGTLGKGTLSSPTGKGGAKPRASRVIAGLMTEERFRAMMKANGGLVYVYRMVDLEEDVVKWGTTVNPFERVSGYDGQGYDRMEVMGGPYARPQALSVETTEAATLRGLGQNIRANTLGEMRGGAEWYDNIENPVLTNSRPMISLRVKL